MSYQDAFLVGANRCKIPALYLQGGRQNATARRNLFHHLMEQRKLPTQGWDQDSIEILLKELSELDSNNFPNGCGVGEREGRVFSSLVARRHYNFSHGIGRSGNLVEAQPKAGGSSLLYKLTNALALDLLRRFVTREVSDAVLVPVATGMGIALTLQAMKKLRPSAKYVIWSRIDQKSCFKSILNADLIPVVVDPVLNETGDELTTNLEAIQKHIKDLGEDNILCVISTTSCFAPRGSDLLSGVGTLLRGSPIYHLVNNAYGLQSDVCCSELRRSVINSLVDVFIQSTDKNLMVPVGGCIVAGCSNEILDTLKGSYPGRASISPVIDTFVTLLEMGESAYVNLRKERNDNYIYLKCELTKVATEFGERVFTLKNNDVSLGMSLKFLRSEGSNDKYATKLGSMLFVRNVNGARVVSPTNTLKIGKYEFKGWGAHCEAYPVPYLTVAAAIGLRKWEIDEFIKKLRNCMKTLVDEDIMTETSATS